MRFIDAVQSCFLRFATFDGRSGRPEFWWFLLFGLGGSLLLDLVVMEDAGLVFDLVVLTPSVAVGVRRLHDVDRSGWWQLLPFGPLLLMFLVASAAALPLALASGALALATAGVLLYWCAQSGTPGPNRFGAAPLPPVTPRA